VIYYSSVAFRMTMATLPSIISLWGTNSTFPFCFVPFHVYASISLDRHLFLRHKEEGENKLRYSFKIFYILNVAFTVTRERPVLSRVVLILFECKQ